MEAYLGIDVGSVSTNFALIDGRNKVISSLYKRTMGQPIKVVQEGLQEIRELVKDPLETKAVGTTGSARYLSGVIVGADVIKNEITAHAVAASHFISEVQTVIEIGGQDSKIIIIRNGVVVDFGMNTICAAGTGSFLDHQAQRLGIPIEEFGSYALQSEKPSQIAGRCTVFAESDMVHKFQVGYKIEDVISGLCQALVRNYLNNVAKAKELLPPFVFQGGVAANAGIKKSLEKALGYEVIIPEYYSVMGAIGAALLAKERSEFGEETKFRGFSISEIDYQTGSFTCKGCDNNCEVVKIMSEGETLAKWGGRCGKWEVEQNKEVY